VKLYCAWSSVLQNWDRRIINFKKILLKRADFLSEKQRKKATVAYLDNGADCSYKVAIK